jgi:hypothetical protein
MSAGHLSSLGLAGLYLEFMAARAACNARSMTTGRVLKSSPPPAPRTKPNWNASPASPPT